MVEVDLGQRGMFDQFAGIAGVEHAIEVLAATQLDGFVELLNQHTVVGDRPGIQREHRVHSGGMARSDCRLFGERGRRNTSDQQADDQHRPANGAVPRLGQDRFLENGVRLGIFKHHGAPS